MFVSSSLCVCLSVCLSRQICPRSFENSCNSVCMQHLAVSHHNILTSTNAVRIAAFWRDNKAELQQHFPPSQEYTDLQHYVEDFNNTHALPNVLLLEALPDGCIYALVKDWPSFLGFKEAFQDYTHGDFYSHSSRSLKDQTDLYYYCR